METLLTILFLIGAVFVHSFMKKKQEREAETWLDDMKPDDGERPRRASRPARPSPTNWEEELRRFLEGEQAPPPVVRPEPTRKPPPLVRSESVTPPRPAPPPLIIRPVPAPVHSYESDEGRGLPVRLPELSESARAIARASQIDARVEEHLRQVAASVGTHSRTPVSASPRRPQKEVLALIKDRSTLRAAIVASIVLGPPKALER